MNSLKEKTALITGAGSGIGKAIAVLFSREGAKVVLADINQPNLEAVAAEIRHAGGEVAIFSADVSRSAM